MSPNVGNFVHDLVEMAKAMETLPLVERQLVTANGMIENYAKQVQDREIAIIAYKQEIDDLHAKVRSLEVERDDASFRVLESEDLAHKALSFAKQAETAAAAVMSLLDPPKPEPMKEPEPQPVPTLAEGQSELNPTGSSSDGQAHSGQSESSPTVDSETGKSLNAISGETQLDQGSGVETTTAISVAEPPYFGKRYADIKGYVSYIDWIDGGGADKDYDLPF